MLKLDKSLEKEYKIVDERVLSIREGDLKIKTTVPDIKDGIITIPSDMVWYLPRISGNNVTAVTKILKHAFCIILFDQFNLSSKIIRQGWVTRPYEFGARSALYEIEIVGGKVACGESSPSNLSESMQGYVGTMALKRAFDRFVILALGLYEQGFYSEDEVNPSMLKSGGITNSLGVSTKKRDDVRNLLSLSSDLFSSPSHTKAWLAQHGFPSTRFIDMDEETVRRIIVMMNEYKNKPDDLK